LIDGLREMKKKVYVEKLLSGESPKFAGDVREDLNRCTSRNQVNETLLRLKKIAGIGIRENRITRTLPNLTEDNNGRRTPKFARVIDDRSSLVEDATDRVVREDATEEIDNTPQDLVESCNLTTRLVKRMNPTKK
jgi:hypothetical protein